MASRRDVRDAFYNELIGAATGTFTVTYGDGSTDTVTLDAGDVALIGPEDEEQYPRVIYDENYRPITYNGAGAGPDNVVRDSNGDVTKAQWREYEEAMFAINVRAKNEIEKEPIYESIKQAFGKYQMHPWPASDLHSDVVKVTVFDSDSSDVIDVERAIRGDLVEVRIEFYRNYELVSGTDVDVIDQINHEIDADLDDGTSGLSYTTS